MLRSKIFAYLKVFSVIVILFSTFFISEAVLQIPAHAKVELPSGRENLWTENNIVFYNPNGSTEKDPCANIVDPGSGDDGGHTSTELSALQESFVKKWHTTAETLSIQYGIPWETVVAQGVVESTSGTSPLAVDKNNFFGIGAYDGCAYTCGKSYPTPMAGWRGYYENIKHTKTYRNHGVFRGNTVTDPYAYLAAIKAAGYATDQNYISTVSKIIGAIKNLSTANGWASSASLAASHPEWAEHAANNAVGGNDYIGGDDPTYNECTDPNPDPGVTPPSVDGWVFPISGATKSNYLEPNDKNGQSDLSPLPCKNYANGGCHHDYAALDMGINYSNHRTAGSYGLDGKYPDYYFLSAGAKVLAIADGSIVSYKTYGRAVSGWQSKCASVQYKTSDGTIFWIGHMSYDATKHAGDTFSAGDVIGEIGPPPCAIGTQSHVHFQVGTESNTNAPTTIYDIMNPLYEALNN